MKNVSIPLALALAATTLVSCAPAPEPTAGVSTAGVSIVASTNVYGSIAEEIAGPHAVVVSVIDNPAQDPHSFEAGPRVQLELSRADVVIVNGGGYDDVVDILAAGAGNITAHIITAVDVSGLSAEKIEENEHVWYDLNTAHAVAETLAEALSRIDPDHAVDYRTNLETFASSLTGLRELVADIAGGQEGKTVVVTEPVPLYLLAAVGFADLTPVELSTAIENDNGVPPAVMNDALKLLGSGRVSLFVYNEQTEGPETQRLLSAAAEHDIPAVGVTETIPDGLSYLEWMAKNIRALEEAIR